MQAVLIIEDGWQIGQRRWIGRNEQLTIGASAWADFVVEQSSLQPIHMVMSLSSDGCWMQSVNNATFSVNGQPKTHTPLNHNDLVRVGDFACRVELQGVEQAATSSAVPSPTNALPHKGSTVEAPVLVHCHPHDSRFWRFEPSNQAVDAQTFAARVAARVPLYVLCRFDRWSFPVPVELADCVDSVPAAESSQALPYLPLFFPVDDLPEWADKLKPGMDAGELVLLAARADKLDLLAFLRKEPGLFLSPIALKNVLVASQDGVADTLLGPIDGVLLGSPQAWQFFARRRAFPDTQFLGYGQSTPSQADDANENACSW